MIRPSRVGHVVHADPQLTNLPHLPQINIGRFYDNSLLWNKNLECKTIKNISQVENSTCSVI